MHRRRAIDRLFASDLPPAAEERLRAHLHGCEHCRRYHDEQALLFRALSGDPARATAEERERAVARALRGANLPAPPGRSDRPWIDGLLGSGRQLAWVGLSVALIAGVLLFHYPAPQAAAQLVAGRDVIVAGRAASPGQVIEAGVPVEVAMSGLAELRLERGGTARLYPGTRLSLAPRGERVDLDQGKVWCEVDKGKGAFVVRTDRGEARVLGTSFVVERLEGGDTEVRVMSGSVQVEDSQRLGSVRVGSGQKTHIARDAPPSPVKSYTGSRDRSDWDRLFGELVKRLRSVVSSIKDKLAPP